MKRRHRVLLGILFLGFAVLVRYAMRDMQLDVNLLREGLMRMPGLVMENLQMEREVSGDLWQVRVPYLDREKDLVTIRSLDVRRQIKEGGEWYFFGAEGVYSHDEGRAMVRGVHGTLETPERTWNLEGAVLRWDDKSREFTFPEGLTLYDSEFLLVTPKASMDEAGVVLLEKGGSLQWTRPLE